MSTKMRHIGSQGGAVQSQLKMRHIDAHCSGDPCGTLEPVKIVANGHGQREELFEGLPRFPELHGDPAGFEIEGVLAGGDFL